MATRMSHHLAAVAPTLRWEPTSSRVRAWLGGEVVVDSLEPILVWEPARLVPVYAVAASDVHGQLIPADSVFPATEPDRLPAFLGPADFAKHTCAGVVMDLRAGGTHRMAAGFVADDLDLGGRVLLDFDAFDRWQVEDEELIGHPHDPLKRIDVVRSSRHVEVSLDGRVLADSTRARVLLETHLPPRWYLPPDDVRLDLMVPSEHRTTCAYKGHASYLSLADGSADDIAWRYADPLTDALPVRDLICFWSERTDLRLDGVAVPRPVTPWSPPEDVARAGGVGSG